MIVGSGDMHEDVVVVVAFFNYFLFYLLQYYLYFGLLYYGYCATFVCLFVCWVIYFKVASILAAYLRYILA